MDQTPGMTIRKLHVESFGCLKDVTVELEPLTVFVGPNDSGKSTLLRALTTLSEASRNREGWRAPFPDPATLVAQTFNGRGDAVRFGLEGELETAAFDYDVTVGATSAYTAIRSERIHLGGVDVARADMKFTFRSPGDTNHQKDAPDGTLPLLHRDYLLAGALRTLPDVAGRLNALVPLFRAARAMSLYSLRPESLRFPMGPGTPLHVDGTGLSAVMANVLLNERDVAERIEAALCTAMPHVKRLRIPQRNGENGQLVYEVELMTRSGARIPSAMISDGVLLYLGYLYLVLGPNPASVLLVEEPETGIQFGLLRNVVKLFRDMTKGAHGGPPTQVLLTTHSPMLLNLVEPEEIRVVQRDEEGTTRVSRFADAPELDKFLDYQGPGEIWVNQGEEYLTRKGAR